MEEAVYQALQGDHSAVVVMADGQSLLEALLVDLAEYQEETGDELMVVELVFLLTHDDV